MTFPGHCGRYSENAEHRTPNAERRMKDEEKRKHSTLNADNAQRPMKSEEGRDRVKGLKRSGIEEGFALSVIGYRGDGDD